MRSAWDSSHAPSVAWASGSWSVELRDDELADILFDGRRVLRSIRAVVRDRDWNTAMFAIESVVAGDDELEVRVSTAEFGADIRGSVRAVARGSELEVTFEAFSANEFLTNRTGLVVLHPHQVAGGSLTVVHSHGEVEQTSFPRAISPHQPVFDIAALSWLDDGLAIRVGFEGDVFEMEDQRNWSDASFKTYSRPLELPFPYALGAGERVRQRVIVAVEPVAAPAARSGHDRIVLRSGGRFPAIGVGASTAPCPAPAFEPIGGELLVELDLSTPNWQAALDRAVTSRLPLDVRVVAPRTHSTALRDLADALVDAAASTSILRIAIFDPELHVSTLDHVSALRAALGGTEISIPVIGGARSHFTELTREQARMPDDVDGVVFSVTPLFHSIGTEQLVESLAVQRLVAQQAVRIAGGRPVHVGPVTLRPRFNNVATAPEAAPTRTDLAEGYGAEVTGFIDPRQSSPELAAWTIAATAALAVPGVASISFFEEWGARGIRTADGAELPVAAALRALTELSGGELLSGVSPDGLLWAIGALGEDATTVLVANLDAVERRVHLTLEQVGETVPEVTASVPALSFVKVQRAAR